MREKALKGIYTKKSLLITILTYFKTIENQGSSCGLKDKKLFEA